MQPLFQLAQSCIVTETNHSYINITQNRGKLDKLMGAMYTVTQKSHIENAVSIMQHRIIPFFLLLVISEVETMTMKYITPKYPYI